MRKAHTSGIPAEWIMHYKDVLEVPNWKFENSFEYDGVLYIHGEGVTARTKSLRESQSVVQGHRHAEGYVWYTPRKDGSYFGMQVGCGTDMTTYAMAYAKHFPSPSLGCGVVLNKGTSAIYEPYCGKL